MQRQKLFGRKYIKIYSYILQIISTENTYLLSSHCALFNQGFMWPTMENFQVIFLNIDFWLFSLFSSPVTPKRRMSEPLILSHRPLNCLHIFHSFSSSCCILTMIVSFIKFPLFSFIDFFVKSCHNYIAFISIKLILTHSFHIQFCFISVLLQSFFFHYGFWVFLDF